MPRIDWVDLSKWQGVIPTVVYRLWRSVGVQGVIFKVGGGNAGRYRDSAFVANLGNAQAAGLLTQGYWFNGETDPVGDAEFAHSVTPPGFFIWADIENEGSMPHWNPPQANAFQTRLEQLGHPTGAYMSQSVTFGDWSLINRRPLWVAAYGPSSVPRVGSWRAPVLWQHSSSGQLPGYGGRLDVNEVQPGFTTTGVTPLGDEFDMASLDDLNRVVSQAVAAGVAQALTGARRESRTRLYRNEATGQLLGVNWDVPAGTPGRVLYIREAQQARNLASMYEVVGDSPEQALPVAAANWATLLGLAEGTDPVYTAA